MKKRIVSSCLVIIFAFTLLVGCGASVPKGFDEAAAKTKAEEVIALLNAGKYDEIAKEYREDIRSSVSVADWENIFGPQIAEMGSFKENKSMTVKAEKTKNTDETVVMIRTVCVYENGEIPYTVVFDDAGNVIGFFRETNEK